MYRVVLLSLVVSACASSSEYERGTYVRPPPSTTYTPAGAGAPEVGQPGSQRERVPRSENRRVLPPEERPGIWASDGDARRTMELRISRPAPGRVPDGASKEMWRKCWADVAELMRAEPRVLDLSEKEMECLRHMLLTDCAGWLMGRAENAQKGNGTANDRAVLERYFPDGDFDQNAWDEAMVNMDARRHHRRCEGPGADTERVWQLRRPLQQRGRDDKQWRDGVP